MYPGCWELDFSAPGTIWVSLRQQAGAKTFRTPSSLPQPVPHSLGLALHSPISETSYTQQLPLSQCLLVVPQTPPGWKCLPSPGWDSLLLCPHQGLQWPQGGPCPASSPCTPTVRPDGSRVWVTCCRPSRTLVPALCCPCYQRWLAPHSTPPWKSEAAEPTDGKSSV